MMRALDLDLVRRRPAWPGWLLLAVGLLLAGDGLFGYLQLSEDLNQLQNRRTRSQAVRGSGAEPVSEQTQREIDAARRLLQELALPWEALFRSIESAVGKETAGIFRGCRFVF